MGDIMFNLQINTIDFSQPFTTLSNRDTYFVRLSDTTSLFAGVTATSHLVGHSRSHEKRLAAAMPK